MAGNLTLEQMELRYIGRILQDAVALKSATEAGPHAFSNETIRSIWQEVIRLKSEVVLNLDKFISVICERHPQANAEQLQNKLRTCIEAGKGLTPEEFQEYQERFLGLHNNWEEVESLHCPNLPEFPVDELPDSLREWVKALSHATQTPPEMAALFTLAAVSYILSRRVEVEGRSGWIETVNLYVAVLMEPGNRKSQVVKEVTEPVRDKEADVIELCKPNVARKQSEIRQMENRLKKLEKDAAENGDKKSRDEAGRLAEELSHLPVPTLPRFIVDDATPEKVTNLLSEQGGCLASYSAEGGVFEGMKGKYSKNGTSNFEVYLHGHSADPLIVDRIGRPSVRISKPRLTCAYTIQPTVIKGLGEEFRGRGLTGRFLYAFPKSWMGQRQIATPAVDDQVRAAYHAAILDLFDIDQYLTLNLTPEASQAFMEWESEIEGMLDIGGQMELIRDWGAKLAGATLRIAAGMHCVKDWRIKSIEESTIISAIKIARSLIPHADAVLSHMQAKESPADDDAKYLVSWIVRHEKKRFTKTEAQHQCKRRFPKATDIDPALDELCKRKYLRVREPPNSGPGRPPSPRYIVNPTIFSHAENRSQYSRNSIPATAAGDSGNKRSALPPVIKPRPIEQYEFDPSEIDPFWEEDHAKA